MGATTVALASRDLSMAFVKKNVAPGSASNIRLAAAMKEAVGVACMGKCRTKATAQMHLCQEMSLNHLSQQLWQEKHFNRWISSILVLVWQQIPRTWMRWLCDL